MFLKRISEVQIKVRLYRQHYLVLLSMELWKGIFYLFYTFSKTKKVFEMSENDLD